jgi:hypothetical protein
MTKEAKIVDCLFRGKNEHHDMSLARVILQCMCELKVQ